MSGTAPDRRMRQIATTVSTVLLAAGSALQSPALAEEPTWSLGMRSGVLVGVTDLTDEEGVSGQLFARRSTGSFWTLEVAAGFGRIAGQEYATNLLLADGRFLIKPFKSGSWKPHLFAGLGVSRHDIDELTARARSDQKRSGWSATVPVGLGFETALTQRVAFEISTAYAYSFRDDLDGVSLRKGKDALWFGQLGLTFTPAPAQNRHFPKPILATARFQAPPPLASDVPVKQLKRADRQKPGLNASVKEPQPTVNEPDRDGDGLSDHQETTRYFTNPFMADSDGDGLDDRAEVIDHGTNPNRPDSDEDGIGDAQEVRAGVDSPASQTISAERREESAKEPAVTDAPPFEFRTIFFAPGGVALTSADRMYLDSVAAYLIAHPDTELELHGYSDNVGKWAVNLRLSGKRCGVVRDYLVQRGAEDWRLTLEAFGEADPIASNDIAEGRARNRRVEFKPAR